VIDWSWSFNRNQTNYNKTRN